MKTIPKSFKRKIAETAASFAEKFKLGEIETGDDTEIIRAPVLPMAGGMRPVVLVIAKKNSHLALQIRNVAYYGSTGSPTNRTIYYLVKHLFCPPGQRDDGLEEDQVMLMGLLVDQFAAGHRTFDDLLAMVAAATNDVIAFSRAILDMRDGEVYIEVLNESDFDEVPDSLEDLIAGALMHAELLRRCERLMRELLMHESQPSRRWIEHLVAFTRNEEESKAEDDESKVAEKQEEVTI